ncbi:hypothetical protein Syun_011389 [Stephania yunnanensis]|uniref:RING-type domain-containing protein n=1 Tax=Stephania yunnanensis TaxID=152371 RepID=A0AAP0JY58_9MAGN
MAEFKLASYTIAPYSRPLLFVKLPGHEKENPECGITRHSVKIDPYSSTKDCPKPLEKAVLDAFVELRVIDATYNDNNVRDNAIRDVLISSLVRRAEMLATDALNKGRKKMGMEVEIVLRSNYVYDEEAAMQAAMLASLRRSKCRFCQASKNAIDNLEKMMLEPNVFGGCDGSSCRICLEDMEIGSEVTRMPCSHVFHPGCIDTCRGALMVGEELWKESLPLRVGSSRIYQLHGLKPLKWYEVKISYPASSESGGGLYVLVSVEPAGFVAFPNVQERQDVVYNIVSDELPLYGITHNAFWVGVLVLLWLGVALVVPQFLPPYLLQKDKDKADA